MIDEMLQELKETWSLTTGELDDIKEKMLAYAAAAILDSNISKEVFNQAALIDMRPTLDKMNQIEMSALNKDVVPVKLSSGRYCINNVIYEADMDICMYCDELFPKADKDIYCPKHR